jgi:hypothetical protein
MFRRVARWLTRSQDPFLSPNTVFQVGLDEDSRLAGDKMNPAVSEYLRKM